MIKLKQGQTIYIINRDFASERPQPRIVKMFMHSQKEPLPDIGTITLRWNVAFVNKLLSRHSGVDFFTSRRKAISALKLIAY